MVKRKIICFLCGETKWLKLFSKKEFIILQCKNCGMIITADKNWQRTQRSITRTYSQKSYLEGYLRSSTQEKLKKRAQRWLNDLEKMTSGRKLLDIGCGYGAFIKTALKRGWQAEGIEPCKKTVKFIRKEGLKVWQATIASYSKRKQYDVITLLEVLEHLPNPLVIKRIRKNLKDEGILVIMVPNIGSLSAKIAKQNWGWLCFPDHLCHFTPETLTLTLNKAGFKILKLFTWTPRKSFFLTMANYLFPEKQSLKFLRWIMLKIGVFLDFCFPFLASFIIYLQNKRNLSGLMVVYAKKKP